MDRVGYKSNINLVFNVLRSICIFECVESLDEIRIRWRNTRNHQSTTELEFIRLITQEMTKTKRILISDLFPPNESCNNLVSLESR